MALSGLDLAASVCGGGGEKAEVVAGPCEKAGLAVGASEGLGLAEVCWPSVTELVTVPVSDPVHSDNIVVVVGGPS